MSKGGIACISIVRSVLTKSSRYILNYPRRQLYSVFLTTTIRRIESGFINVRHYSSHPAQDPYNYIYHRVSRTCDVRHSPTLQTASPLYISAEQQRPCIYFSRTASPWEWIYPWKWRPQTDEKYGQVNPRQVNLRTSEPRTSEPPDK